METPRPGPTGRERPFCGALSLLWRGQQLGFVHGVWACGMRAGYTNPEKDPFANRRCAPSRARETVS